MNTPMRRLAKQAKIVAILGAVFILATNILQLFIELPTLNNLMFHSPWFILSLLAGLWFIAFLITRFRESDEDE